MVIREHIAYAIAIVAAACGGTHGSAPAHDAPPAEPVATLVDAPVPVRDASPVDTAAPSAAVDPTKLPLITVVDHDRGDETQVYAADADADDLVVSLWPPSQPMLAIARGKPITGQLVAPSRLAAAESIAAAAGMTPVAIAPHSHAAELSLQFGKAPQRDLVRIVADVLHVNIVVTPATYPDLAIIGRRISSADVLAAIAGIDKLRVERAGNITFLVPDGTKLPKLAAGSQLVDLFLWGATPRQALAALGQVAPVSAASCDTTPIELRLRHVTVAEAIRAIAIASGTPIGPGARCPIDRLGTPAATTVLVAVAQANTKSAAVLVTGTTAGLVTKAAGVEIGQGYVTIDGTAYQPERGPSPPMPQPNIDYGPWLATLVRAQAIVREGTRWFARVEITTGGNITLDGGHIAGLPAELEQYPPEVGPTGVDLINPDHHNKTHVPLATK